jgi:uncharacterized membrane protein
VSSLIVITFEGEGTAAEALASVRTVERAGGFGLTDTAEISKNAAGEVHVKNEWGAAGRRPARSSAACSAQW